MVGINDSLQYQTLSNLLEKIVTALRPDNMTGASVSLSSDQDYTDGAIIYVGTGGDLKVDLKGGGTGLTYKNIPDGTTFPLPVTKVYSTANGTTASDLISHVEN